jgi:steroid delta-isomerase-like uncharacterized protein
MTADNEERVRRLFEEAWNQNRTDVVADIVADDFVFSRGGEPTAGGPELYRELISSSRETFPDMTFTLEDVVTGDDGEKVVVRWTMTGTHEGPFKGVDPTHRQVEMEGIEINRFEGGRLVETWTNPNWVGFLEDVGVLPLDDSS